MLPRTQRCVASAQSSAAAITRITLFCCALLLFCFAATGWFAWRGKCATGDEPLDLVAAWVVVHDNDYRMDSEDPPLLKYYVALGTRDQDMPRNHQIPQWTAMLTTRGASFGFSFLTLYRTYKTEADTLLAAARARMIFLGALLGVMIAWWSWRLAGPLAAVVALAVFCLDPNFLAHAALVKNDVPTALLFLALMMSVWLLGERGTIVRMLATALLLGALIVTKYSGLLGIPVLGIALLCRAIGPAPWRILRWTARIRLMRLTAGAAIGAGMLVIVYVMMWGCYSFRFGPASDPAQRFDVQSYVEACRVNEYRRAHNGQAPGPQQSLDWKAHWRPSLNLRLALWANRHELAPQAWIEGFLYTYVTSLVRPTWLCGQTALVGWWYYFPLAMAFKTPLATLLGLCIALAIWPWRRCGSIFARHWWPLLCILIVPVLYMAVAMGARLNLGLRHVLPVYPYLFIFLGVTAAMAWRRNSGIAATITAILLAGLAIETYCAYPDFIPFFNVAAGGARGGLKLLSDSNLDWGQDLPLVAQWERQHPDDAVYLLYFGNGDPKQYGIHSYNMWIDHTPPPALGPDQHFVLAVSATILQGTYLSDEERRQIETLKGQAPIAVLGGSIYLFKLR